LDFEGLKKLGVVLKRARYFITCAGKKTHDLALKRAGIAMSLMSKSEIAAYEKFYVPKQLEFFENASFITAGKTKWLTDAK
jgi:predicted DNA-binding helix-hairpin-helix protein